MGKPNIGVIGMAVMGSNLARNIASRGYMVAVYNRTTSVTTEFMEQHGSTGQFVPAKSLEELVTKTQSPRQLIIMVKAGDPTDAVIEGLIPLLNQGDIIIDGGNAHFPDTIRREQICRAAGVHFLGVGISGGEEGALRGPSIMPGGPRSAWEIMSPVFDKIAAQADGEPCTTYIGPDGAGHFVKMVHNGIEYGDMQLIAEAYHLLSQIGGISSAELADIFEDWNKGVLSSYLIEISAKIFAKLDDQGPGYLVEQILDKAGQKGTGKWTAQAALDLGVAVPTIAAAVDARILSSYKDERVLAARELKGPVISESNVDRKLFVKQVHDALYCSKIMSYAQGMALLSRASIDYSWDLQLDRIAAIWKGGCIIRARFLDDIRRAFTDNPKLSNLLLAPEMKAAVAETIGSLRSVVSNSAACGIPVFGFTSSLAYYDSYRTADLPQNLTQAQRDYFGAHTFQRKDKEGIFHASWL